ncbi:MAG: T9SS type A sorting domain-containing protein, partial [Bacteroidota bacterium]
YDNCTAVTLAVRRMESACGTQPVFAPTVKFCCDDVGEDITVEMRASDQAGNTNSCMVIVHVDDKTPPLMTCPGNVSIHCTEDPDNLILTGQPTVVEPCGLESLIHDDIESVNLCNVGFIVRVWTATDVNGNSSTCSHTITLTDNTPPLITFPPNYAAPSCVSIASLDPANLPAPYNYPVVVADCEMMATSHTDQIFTVAGQACFQIKRTWKVINWCTYNGGSTGIWQQAQYITVTDNQPPVFTCPANFTVGVAANCKATVTLPAIGIIQDCSPNITVSVSSPLGNGYGPFPNVNPGTYTANYTVSDGCNNTATCSLQFTVVDDKPPTPYCKAGINVEIMPNDSDGDGIIDGGMIELWASDFDDNSSDNCNSLLNFSFSGTANEPNRVFDCEDVGQNTLQIWVSDASGNKDFCETILNLQDNMGWCSGAQFASVGGAVTNEMGENMADVQVSVNDGVSPPAMTDAGGNFSFAALQLGNDYTVSAEKDTLLLNGVTTWDILLIRRHILAMEFLTTPYKIIAADVNHSGAVTTTDLVAMQKAILHVTEEFPNNKSWRFVDAGYDFQNPANPLAEAFPEVYNINNLSGNMLSVNFIGIKVGDVNDSAQPNEFAQSNEDRSGEPLQISVADTHFEQGREQAVDFTVKNFKAIVGYQFTLHFDPAALDFLRLEKGELASVSEHNFGFRFLDEGILTTSWNDFQPVSLPDDAVLFRLIFQPKTSGALSQNLHISSDYTAAEAYHDNGELLGVNLDFTQSPITNHQSPITIIPNPFSESTAVGFDLPQPQEATLTVFDAAGRQVKTVQGNFPAGWNELKIKAEELAGAGTYFFRLAMAGDVRTGKLVLVGR